MGRARSSLSRSGAGALLATLPSFARAFTFTFGTTPTQCQNATINIIGDDGVPPYNIVILAYGNPPGGNEVRKIIDHSFTDPKSSVLVAFPSNSQFVAVVSDSTGFGKGGTTLSVNTASSNDSSCLPTKETLSPGFYLIIDNLTDIHTCQSRRIGYSVSPASEGKVTIYGIIPGGDSFAIDMSGATTLDGSLGINWTPNIPPFTDIIFMGGDDRGRGSGGSTDRVNIQSGPNKDCLTGDYPLSTVGTPAGQVFPTDSSVSTPNSGSGGTNIGAIVGGVIGALVFVILVLASLLFYFWRRRRQNRNNHIKEKPDLTDDPRPLAASVENNHELTAEPFIVPPSITSGSRPGTPSEATGPGGAVPPSAWARGHRPSHSGASNRTGGQGRPQSMATTDEGGAPSTFGGLSAWERKHGAAGGPQLRPVNIIQHDDGGEVGGEADTVELPPAYGNIRPRASPTPTSTTTLEGVTPPAVDVPPPAHH
ncbi:hypothetical protein BKA62DRAFT_774995 [Auriculariales sp. MPI-PUGE-AT-0066]|nr:hypothetical protein BKA62DRAFT_774995 [Auriculariales sp. MPI-PUGE-AT-0066]